ncbi:hypothetical protein SLS62_002027 [Diatrype stigma]|uniref:Uncharacterized protein n=1 Tax=Diatrype stigma TaxID=117547 RepID=A0AAN9UV20_9PEZI
MGLQVSAAAESNDIYERIANDDLVIGDGKKLCFVQKLFQQLPGTATTEKVTDAIRKWSALPPLPQADKTRHAVNELIRRDNHPELDIEKVRTLEELEQRTTCAQQGHSDPDGVHLTEDTVLGLSSSWCRFRNRPDFARQVLPRFQEGVLDVSSKVVRCLLRSIAPKEYEDA